MKTITIFTPTYNRAYTIHKLYNSLLRQTNSDFEWLIIDDGSTDNSKELINSWIIDGKIPIRYIAQSNRGMLAAHNTAYDNIHTYLNVCVDSDDYLVDNAIERILTYWKENNTERNAGLLGLDIEESGTLIGTEFPNGLLESTFTDLKKKYNNKGDKKFVYRTDVINEFPRFPSFNGEKFPAAGYLYRLIDQKYTLLLLNEPLCVVEYMNDGNSKNKFSSYKKNPNAFMHYRLEMIFLSNSILDKFKESIHYVSSCIFASKYEKIFINKYFYLTIPVIPMGVALNIYLRKTEKKGLIK